MKRQNLILLGLVLAFLTLASILSQIPDNNLHVIACDVGQGDAILITYKNIQILTDGGPDRKVMSCLGRHMPFYDRELELVISTHPDSDHSSGLTYVLKNYKVGKIIINPIDSGTQIIKVLEKMIGSKGIGVIRPVEGVDIRLGLIYLDIVNPSSTQVAGLKDVATQSPLSFFIPVDPTNEYSVSYRLRFKKFVGIFTGDISPEVSDRLAGVSGLGSVHYIKIPHHGSKNGITENLLKKLMPKVAVISVGKNNFGHPAPEVLKLLRDFDVRTYRTDEGGDIELITDGETYKIKK